MPRQTDRRLAAFRKFNLAIQKNPDYLFCFFEGSDEVYYAERIKMFTEKYKIIPCGGRQRLLKTYQLIKANKEYDKYKKAFFLTLTTVFMAGSLKIIRKDDSWKENEVAGFFDRLF